MVGLVIAGLLCVSAARIGFHGQHYVFLRLFIVLLGILIGGGALINLANRGLLEGPTRAMLLGYGLTVGLLPFALWGYVLMKRAQTKSPIPHHRHHHRRHRHRHQEGASLSEF